MNLSDIPGPFFHGTKASLRVGDLLTPGFPSNYRPEITMNHVYFTAVKDGAGLAAEIAPVPGEPHVNSGHDEHCTLSVIDLEGIIK